MEKHHVVYLFFALKCKKGEYAWVLSTIMRKIVRLQ